MEHVNTARLIDEAKLKLIFNDWCIVTSADEWVYITEGFVSQPLIEGTTVNLLDMRWFMLTC